MKRDKKENQANVAQKTFDSINAMELLELEFEPLQFSVDEILTSGLFLLAGSPKGMSRLKFCNRVMLW